MANEPSHPASLTERCLAALEHSHHAGLYIALLVGLLLLMLYPFGLTGNEENYLQLAYRAVRPDQFTPYHAAFDASHARFASEYLFGGLVAWLGYENAHRVLRLGMALLYAAGLSQFFRAAKLPVIDALLVIVLFDRAGEQLLGGEWLFYGVESKTLAYGLLLPAFGFAKQGRWVASLAACVAATYMHFLVGGFWAFIMLLLYWLDRREIKRLLSGVSIYVLLISPLLYLIARDQLGGAALPEIGLSADKIYAEIRNPHHIAPFAGRSAFWSFWGWLPGLVASLCLAWVMAYVVRRQPADGYAWAGLFGLLELLLAMLVAYLDRGDLHFAKLYLFRPSSLTLFLVITVLVGGLSSQLTGQGRRLQTRLAVALVVSFAGWRIHATVDYYRQHVFTEKAALVAAVAAHSQPGDIVLIEPYQEFAQEYLSLHREIGRPTLVSWKFVPTNPADILHWYSLIQLRQQIYQQGCPFQTTLPIRWLIALSPESAQRLASCGPVVWQAGKAALIRVGN